LTSTAYLQGATAVGLLLGGALADRLYRRIKTARYGLVALGLLISAPAVQLLGNSDSLVLTKCAASAFGFGSGLAIANFFASSFDVIPFGMRSAAVGYLNMLGGLFSGIAALLGGMLKESLGIHTLMSAAAGLCLVMSGLLILGTRIYFKRDFDRAQGAAGIA
jgi:MFS family permease